MMSARPPCEEPRRGWSAAGTAAAFALLAFGAGCGDLSQEDLIFRAAVPSKSAVELRPAGAASEANASDSSTSQALEAACAEGDLRCTARQTARGINNLTFSLLDLVDAVTAQPPTTRARGKRVWGPFFVADKGFTARFEMDRVDDTTFGFCLHAVAGPIGPRKGKDVTCDTDVDDDSGLAVLLSGSFSPGEIQDRGARSGSGDMTLEVARLPDFGTLGRELSFQFDNDGHTHITVDLDGVVRPDGSTATPLHYDFLRETDGSGTFDFEVIADIPLRDVDNTPRLEDLHIAAAWNAEQAGRAHGGITGGDAGAGVQETQCWDDTGTNSFVEFVGPDGNSVTEPPDSDDGVCLFDENLDPR